VVGATEHHHDAVDAGRDASMRRHAVGEGLEQGPEARPDHVERHAEQLEDALLHPGVVDPQASSAELVAVAHDVVRVPAYVVRPLFDERHVLDKWPREGEMRGGERALIVLVKEELRIYP